MKLVGKVRVVKERLTMVVVIGKMVDETYFKRKIRDGMEVALIIWIGMKNFENFINTCRRERWENLDCKEGQSGVEWVKCLRIFYRWRLDTLSEKKVAKDLASDDLCIMDGSVVVWWHWSKVHILFQSRTGLGIEDWMSLALKFLSA